MQRGNASLYGAKLSRSCIAGRNLEFNQNRSAQAGLDSVASDNEEKDMASAAHLLTTSIDRDWLTSRTFTFAAEGALAPITETFGFQEKGLILGYSHPNERYWSLKDDHVDIIDYLGNVTCRMRPELRSDGGINLVGAFLNPAGGYAENGTKHLLIETTSPFRSKRQSFDLFDTLVARKCFDPLEIFRIVEAKAALTNFAAARHRVEMSMFGKIEYGLDDIYDQMIGHGFVNRQQAAVLKRMELQEEWDNLFPIHEVIAHVEANDIVISDMYLPYEFVKRVLVEKCGLQNELYLSNYGKHNRHIWPKVKALHDLDRHFGDNIHADIIGASESGVQPILVSISKWSKSEEILRSIGLEDYAKVLRKTRLEIPHGEPATVNALKAQVAINLPLLILGSLWLLCEAKKFQANRVLTCARDCNLLHRILSSHHFIRAGFPPAQYIGISRTLCREGGDDYEAYLLNKTSDGVAFLVDMVGTGQSLTQLIARRNLSAKVKPLIVVADPLSGHHFPGVATFLRKDFASFRFFVETMNICNEGSAIDAVVDRELTSIVYHPYEYDAEIFDIIRASSEMLDRFIIDLNEILSPSDLPGGAQLSAAAEEISQQIGEHAPKLMRLIRQHGSKLGALTAA